MCLIKHALTVLEARWLEKRKRKFNNKSQRVVTCFNQQMAPRLHRASTSTHSFLQGLGRLQTRGRSLTCEGESLEIQRGQDEPPDFIKTKQ